jgi:hypothetical protein
LKDASKVLLSKHSGVLGEGTTPSERQMLQKANIRHIIFPWMPGYKIWWSFTAIGAIFTVFFGPFEVAFEYEPGTFNDMAAVVELVLTSIFAMDIVVNFNLAFYKHELLVFERNEIFKEYFSHMFWVNFVGVLSIRNHGSSYCW